MKDALRMRTSEAMLLKIASSRAYVHQLVVESVLNEKAANEISNALKKLFVSLPEEDQQEVMHEILSLVASGTDSIKSGKQKNIYASCTADEFKHILDGIIYIDSKFEAAYDNLTQKGRGVLIDIIGKRLSSSSSSASISRDEEDKKTSDNSKKLKMQQQIEKLAKAALRDTLENFNKLDSGKKDKLIEKLMNTDTGIYIADGREAEFDSEKLNSIKDPAEKLVYIASYSDSIDDVKKIADEFLDSSLSKE